MRKTVACGFIAQFLGVGFIVLASPSSRIPLILGVWGFALMISFKQARILVNSPVITLLIQRAKGISFILHSRGHRLKKNYLSAAVT